MVKAELTGDPFENCNNTSCLKPSVILLFLPDESVHGRTLGLRSLMRFQELVTLITLYKNSCRFKGVHSGLMTGRWSSFKRSKRTNEIFFLSSTCTETDPSLTCYPEITNRPQATAALSYLSLNTYQNQLEPHSNSKQVIFLMTIVIDAWQWTWKCWH